MKAFLIAFLIFTSCAAHSDEIEPLSHFPRASLSIKTHADKVHRFDVWIADTPSRQQQGLMFVRSLDAHRGMVFVYARPARLTMWMKNTLIPLDMVFIDQHGRIVDIAHDTTPESLDIVAPASPATAVLELKGGDARVLGFATGDHVNCTCLVLKETSPSGVAQKLQ